MGRSRTLEDRLQGWQQAGLLDTAQLDAIVAWEATHGDAEPPASPWRRRIVLVTGFVGIVLAIGASAVILAEYWGDLTSWARVALAAMVTAVLLAAGESARRSGAGLRRLASFSWVLAVAGFAWVAGLLLFEVGDVGESGVAVAVSGASLLLAAALWHRLPSALQLVGFFVAAEALGASLVSLHDHADPVAFGPVIWLVGVVVALAAWSDVLRPTGTAWLLGALGAGVGATVLGAVEPTLGILLGLATAAALLWASVGEREPLLLWLGVLGMLEFVPWGLVHFLGVDRVDVGGGSDMAVVLGALVAGLFVLGWSLREARRWEDREDEDVEPGEAP